MDSTSGIGGLGIFLVVLLDMAIGLTLAFFVIRAAIESALKRTDTRRAYEASRQAIIDG